MIAHNSAHDHELSGERTRALRLCVVGLFFLWGFSTVLIDTLVPRFKALFALSYAEVMLTQFAFFMAYFIVSVPAGLLVARIGYVRSIVIGLATMTAGCLLFVPASAAVLYTLFLAALFVLAAGISVLQVAANPLIAQLGAAATAHSRLNLAQAFNSLGTFVGPFFGAWLILGSLRGAGASPTSPAERVQQAHALQLPFLYVAAVIAVAVAVFATFWNRGPRGASGGRHEQAGLAETFTLLRRPRTALGRWRSSSYVGAEVTIGSLMVNYLMSSHTLGLAAATAGAWSRCTGVARWSVD